MGVKEASSSFRFGAGVFLLSFTLMTAGLLSFPTLRWGWSSYHRRLCRASWKEARVAVAVGAFVSPLSEHVSPEQPGGAPLVDGPALNCNQWHVPADGPALNCNQDMFRLQLWCSGGTSNLGVDAGLRWRLSFSLHARGFEGWCSPRCFGPRTASGRCCGDGDSSLVRESGLQTRMRTAARWP